MNKFFLSIPVAFLLFASTISVKDFKPAFGKWKGTLTYLDYTSGRPYSMPCNISISADKSDKRRLILEMEYPDEPRANGKDTIVFSADGKMIGDELLVSNEKIKGVTKIVAEKNGVDGNENRKAVLRYTYEFSRNSLSKRKEVKFDGKDKWILRNEYKMTR